MNKDQASGGQKGSQSNYKANYKKIDWSVGREERHAVLAAAQAKKDARVPSRGSTAFTEFISPVDKTVISDRGQLARHNKRHGVTNIRDYGEAHFAKRGKEMYLEKTGQTKAAKEERKAVLREVMHRKGLY